MHERRKMDIKYLFGNLRGRENSHKLRVGGRTLLKWIAGK
jgi:hypothetical protein